jgi:RimJ/RimL family protein N-acetyltransferase
MPGRLRPRAPGIGLLYPDGRHGRRGFTPRRSDAKHRNGPGRKLSGLLLVGLSRYAHHDPDKSEIEIGWTFLARSHWGGATNAEMKRLMIDHAFTFVDCVTFQVGETNLRSQGAMRKIGGVLRDETSDVTLDGITYRHLIFEIRKRR